MKMKSSQNKCKDIIFYELKSQDYLSSKSLTTEQKKLLFSMRTKTCPVLVNTPFRATDNNILCPCRGKSEDSMDHQIVCSSLTGNNTLVDPEIKIEDIFSQHVQKQSKITILFEQAMTRRKLFLNRVSVL